MIQIEVESNTNPLKHIPLQFNIIQISDVTQTYVTQ